MPIFDKAMRFKQLFVDIYHLYVYVIYIYIDDRSSVAAVTCFVAVSSLI